MNGTPPRLTLYPASPAFAPADAAALRGALQGRGLLGEPYPQAGASCYLAGAAFLELIMFLGCAPQVRTQPGEDGQARDAPNFYYLELPPGFPEVQFLGTGKSRPPRCPQCKTLEKDWQTQLARWERAGRAADFPWTCPGCGAVRPFCELDWRQTAGFGKIALHVWGVFEGEAVPGERLLDMLRQATGTVWRYCYA